ncbi:hypothetical protein RIF29_19204 [Crotalaria pallida]|uniref:Uncharacterized protein n=1 Tax=Crotalaria pallida TaxID=3830 RepID=A0AAN9F0C0_CROPI
MARKKGRPPKSPSPASPPISSIPKNLELEHLDDDDFEDIDALSPKKAASILRKLDALRSRIKGKAIEGDKEGNSIADVPNQPESVEKEASPKRAFPSREDIERMDDALKLNKSLQEGSVPIDNVEVASQAVKEVIQNQCEDVSWLMNLRWKVGRSRYLKWIRAERTNKKGLGHQL